MRLSFRVEYDCCQGNLVVLGLVPSNQKGSSKLKATLQVNRDAWSVHTLLNSTTSSQFSGMNVYVCNGCKTGQPNCYMRALNLFHQKKITS